MVKNTSMKHILILLAAVIIFINGFAASVDTAVIYSQVMKKGIKCVIIKPDNYTKE